MQSILAFGLGGPYDIAIIAGVLILLFGGSKFVELGKSLGTGIREFKSSTQDEEKPAVPAGPITQPALPLNDAVVKDTENHAR